MKIYIDCDGVILDTESHLFDEYYKLKEKDPSLRKSVFLQGVDWDSYLETVKDINDALYLLRSYDPEDVSILTKVNSISEGIAKIAYFRRHNIKNNIIVVPYILSKDMVVDARGNILVDDYVGNLEAWQNAEGLAIYFGLNDTPFVKISSLQEVLNSKTLMKRTLKRF